MKVVIKKHAYSMTPQKFKEVLAIASENVPFGIYCVERVKERYAELRNDRFKSVTQLKRAIHEWEHQGFKVHYNKGR